MPSIIKPIHYLPLRLFFSLPIPTVQPAQVTTLTSDAPHHRHANTRK